MRTTDTRSAQARTDEARGGRSPGLAQRAVAHPLADSPRMQAQRLQIAQAFGLQVVQRQPPDDPHVFTYEDSEGLVWSRDADDRWYRPGDKPGDKIYWGEEAEAEDEAPVVDIPAEPSSTKGVPETDGFHRFWAIGDLTYDFSSGHGYRVNHHKKNQPPSKNIRELGSMTEVERAILAHILGPGGIPEVGKGGTRAITVGGQPVEYRCNRFSVDKMGIGTYYRPD
jgi:hypothetical protein